MLLDWIAPGGEPGGNVLLVCCWLGKWAFVGLSPVVTGPFLVRQSIKHDRKDMKIPTSSMFNFISFLKSSVFIFPLVASQLS